MIMVEQYLLAILNGWIPPSIFIGNHVVDNDGGAIYTNTIDTDVKKLFSLIIMPKMVTEEQYTSTMKIM